MRSCSSPRAVSINTGVRDPGPNAPKRTSNPVISGSITSSTTRACSPEMARSTPFVPLCTDSTVKPSPVRYSAMSSHSSTSSSTMRTRCPPRPAGGSFGHRCRSLLNRCGLLRRAGLILVRAGNAHEVKKVVRRGIFPLTSLGILPSGERGLKVDSISGRGAALVGKKLYLGLRARGTLGPVCRMPYIHIFPYGALQLIAHNVRVPQPCQNGLNELRCGRTTERYRG